MAIKRHNKKRRRSSTSISNPRRNKKSSAKKRPAATRRKKKSSAKKRRNTTHARKRPTTRRRSASSASKRRKNSKRRSASKRRNSAAKGMEFAGLPILHVAGGAVAAIALTQVLSRVSYIQTVANKAGKAAPLVLPAVSFGVGFALTKYVKNANVKAIGKWMCVASLIVATDALLSAPLKKLTDKVPMGKKTPALTKKTAASVKKDPTAKGMFGAYGETGGLSGVYALVDETGGMSGQYAEMPAGGMSGYGIG
jgi:hypothetical protein